MNYISRTFYLEKNSYDIKTTNIASLLLQKREKTYEIKDEYGSFPVIPHEDHTVTILNGKILNLLDEMPSIEGIEAFRLNFTIESADEVAKIVKEAQKKLEGKSSKSLFNQETDTRGHFNKEII